MPPLGNGRFPSGEAGGNSLGTVRAWGRHQAADRPIGEGLVEAADRTACVTTIAGLLSTIQRVR
jgi:hypothetical protein